MRDPRIIRRHNKAQELRVRLEIASKAMCRALESLNSHPQSVIAQKLNQLRFLLDEYDNNHKVLLDFELPGIVVTLDHLVKKMREIIREAEELGHE